MEFANKTQLNFEPGLSKAFGINATGSQYTTPEAVRETLADLSRLSYVKGQMKGKLFLDAANGAAVVTVSVKAGASVVASCTVNCDGASEYYFSSDDVNLSQVNGGQKLHVDVDISTVAGASVNAQVSAQLSIEHPLIIS